VKFLIPLTLAGVCIGATPAWGSDTAAEALFRAGKRAIATGDYPTACQKFDQSQQLEPAPGTLLNLADCEEHLGRLALASEHFNLAALGFHPGDKRVAYARQRAVVVQGHMPSLTIHLPANANERLKILCDGIEIDPAAFDHPLRVDPGQHVVLVRGEARRDRSYPLELSEGESKELSVEAGEGLSAQSETPAAPPADTRTSPSMPRVPAATLSRSPAERAGPSRTLGWISVGLGGAGLAVGTVFAIRALSNRSTVDQHCSTTCDPQGYDAESAYKTASRWASIGLGAAVLGIGAGTYFFVARPFDRRTRIDAQTANGGFTLHVSREF